ncbi:MAG: helix-turn-helix domain-containing protein [Deltaproteobacteria bacterium]|nr:helix-turn-helix domain-containing protein [Deltaproteobacteria bacterium]
MRPIPLINAEHAVRVATLLDSLGVPADRYLERARISPKVREDPRGFLPGRSVWKLVGSASRREGLDDFWLGVAGIAGWRGAGWAPPMARAVTLGDALRVMCRSYVRQIPMNELGLTRDGDVTWFWRRRVADVHDWEGDEPAEQYTLSFMLAVIREVAGPEWLPNRLQVESSARGWAASTRRLPGVRVAFGRPALAVAVPTPLLSAPFPAATPRPTAEAEPPGASFEASLRQILRPWVTGRLLNQQLAAELIWTSPRTLRRRLAEVGTTWHVLADELRFEHAVKRLEVGRHTVCEVAEELGYSDAAHFTRFFRRRAGVAPSTWRAEVARGREAACPTR